MTHARRRGRSRFRRRAHFIQRGLRVAQTPAVDSARQRVVRLPGFRPARRSPPAAPAADNADVAVARSGEAGARDASGRQEARADDRDAARDRQCLAQRKPRPAPEPKSAIPLTADSLGAQLLLTVSEQVGEISREVADVARTLTHFPAFYYWIVRTANDPSAYQSPARYRVEAGAGVRLRLRRRMAGVPPHQAAGGAPGSAPSANGAAPAQTLADGRSAVIRGRCYRGARTAAAAPQPGAGLAVAGPAALRAGTARARTAPGAGLRRRRHDAAGHRDRRSRHHPARDPRGRQCLCVVARADLRRAGAGGAVRPVSRSRRNRGLYRDLGAPHRRRRRRPASPLPMWRCCSACIAPAMPRCCAW